jgi:hypothetical protein
MTADLQVPDVAAAVLIEGANLACVSGYGKFLRELIQSRALGKSPITPVLIATLYAGPGTLPLGPELVCYGPVLDTDCLTWAQEGWRAQPAGGTCDLAAFQVEEAKDADELWDDLLDELFQGVNGLWDRQSKAAYRRLVSLGNPERPASTTASFLFGWVIPRYIASGGAVADRADSFRTDQVKEAAADDQRLRRLLLAAGWKES